MSARQHRLANGARLVLDPVPGAQTVALGVYLRVGTRWESAAENGIAHFLEHLLFKGAGGRDAQALAEAAEGRGVYLNAATGYERTAYYARALREDAAFALDLLADLLRAPHLADADIAIEQNVVLQEIGEANDSPEDRVGVLHQAAVYPGQPLGRPILGEAATVTALTRPVIARFLAEALEPGRLVIAAAGGFDAAALREAAERRFGDLAPARAAAPHPAHAHAAAAGETRRLDQAHLLLSAPAPAMGAADGPAARVAAEILGGGMASRLFQDVRERRGLAYAIEAYVDAHEDGGRLCVAAGCAPRHAGDLARRTGEHLQALACEGPSAQELARAKRVLKAGLLMSAESLSARAEMAAAQSFLYGAPRPLAATAAEIDAVSSDAVQAIFAAAVAPGGHAGAVVGPSRGLDAAAAFAACFG